jgi:hypothetical protein
MALPPMTAALKYKVPDRFVLVGGGGDTKLDKDK